MAFSALTGTSGINPGFLSQLERLRQIMPNNLGSQIGIKSGYRSPERQAQLFARAVQKYGSVAAARKWVAPPGRSQHGKGNAVDLSFGSPEAMRAAHQYAAQAGLTFPMSYENWHIEPIGARGGKGIATPAADTGTGTSVDTSTANLLASAAGGGGDTSGGNASGMGLGGGGGGGSLGGIVGDPTPIATPDLRTEAAAALPSTQPAPPPTPPAQGQLADLFTLPTIGLIPGGAPGEDPLQPALPGQAKALTRKVWK